MSGFLRRSLWQVVAAVVLYSGVGASDLFAATTHTFEHITYGNASKTVVAKHYRKVTLNGMQVWVQVPVDPDPNADPPYDGLGYFSVPLYQDTLLYPGYYEYKYRQTLTNRTPGMEYKVKLYIRTGTPGNYTYTWENDQTWVQP